MKTANQKSKEPNGNTATTVGFRLDEESREALDRRAKRLGVSTHELARDFVFEVLWEGQERAELRHAVSALHREVSELRKDIALALEALLVSTGKATEDEARVYVEENFKRC
jgi:polyhydroxyalkanoate synthesis regulator phasin